MFARAVSIKVKPGCEAGLSRIVEQEVVPRFRQERGFLGFLVFIRLDGTEALSLSLWDKEKSAGSEGAAELTALMALARMIRETPSVHVYKVPDSILRAMERMLGRGEELEAIPDLKVYQPCTSVYPLVARTVHAELRFPARVAPGEFNARGNPIPHDSGGTRMPQEAVQG